MKLKNIQKSLRLTAAILDTGIEFLILEPHGHRVQSLPRKRGRNSGLGVFSRRIAVVFDSFAAILKKIIVGELRKYFLKIKETLCQRKN